MTIQEAQQYIGKNVFYKSKGGFGARVEEANVAAIRGSIITFTGNGCPDHYEVDLIDIIGEATVINNTTVEKTENGESLIEG